MAEKPAGRAFVIGHPIMHSRSPLIHGHWLEMLGISGSYERIDISPAALPDFIRDLATSGYVGGNVTIPHKEAALALVERPDEAAKQIGAVNTLWLEEGVLHAANTDAAGFAANLDQNAPEWRKAESALVLGAGGAARAILHALAQAGIRDIRVVNRTVSRARELADRFGGGISAHGWQAMNEVGKGADLVVNTTSLGMYGKDEVSLDVSLLSHHAIVTDIVYVPLRTPLLEAAVKAGLRTVDGLGMLLHQAVPGFERWFGVRPAVTAQLRELIVANLERGL